MLKIYCTSCGSPTQYSLEKPKFCCSCGKSFNPIKQIEAKTEIKKIVLNEEIEDFDSEEIIKIPNLDKLNFDLNIQKHNSEKLGNLINNSQKGEDSLIQVNKNDNFSIEKNTLENFAKEAGALLPKSVIRKVKNSQKNKN